MKRIILLWGLLLLLSVPRSNRVYADITYPLYQGPGYTVRHFRTLASQRGFPPSYLPLPKPAEAEEVIPICSISEYITEGLPNLAWQCNWEDLGDMVRFELSAYHQREGWVEGTAVLLDTAYFEMVPAGRFDAEEDYVDLIEFNLGSDDSLTIDVDPTFVESILPVITITTYETGLDEDFQFYVNDNNVLEPDDDADDEAITLEIVAENGGEESYIEGRVYFLKANLPEMSWSLGLTRAENEAVFDYPDEESVEVEEGYDLILLPSLISYAPNGDSDFEVRSFPNLSDGRAWFQVSALQGSNESWAEWENIIISIRGD
jgi:hypothetical protein